MSLNTRASHVLIYDGECRICRRSVAWLREADSDGRVEAIPYQDPAVPRRFPEIPGERYREAMQLVSPQGERWEGAEAAEALLNLLPRWRVLGPLFRIPGVRWLAKVTYQAVARNRRRFGCGEHCGLAAPEGDGVGEGA